MSYLALARKYRPRTFADVMGQGHVVKALSHALDGDRLHPAILLTGTRGVGKTTLARIVAKCLNCETGVSANPCGVCTACKEVDEGRFVDLLEIDAASNTGVDDVRQLIENAQYAPARGRYKVYLIDEVHMLSKSAFNALLKTLEEPPPHVKFILATTDPQKLLVTVLSRCLQFNLKRLPVSVIRDQLAKVLDHEGVAYELPALAEVARAADGSMRDGLSLVDQAIAFSGGAPLARGPIEDMLGTSGHEVLLELLRALAVADHDALLVSLQKLEAQAPDYAALLNDLATGLQRIAVLQLLPGARSDEDEEALVALKDQFTPEDVQLCYQIAVHGRRDLPWAPEPRLGFEMTVLRMAAFRPDDGATPAPAPGGGSTRARGTASSPPAAAAASAASSSAAPAARSAPSVKPVPRELPVTVVPTPEPTPEPAPVLTASPPPPPAPPAVTFDANSWSELVETLSLEGFTRQIARNSAWRGRDGEVVRLSLDAKAKHLLSDERCKALEQALAAHLDVSALKLDIEVGLDDSALSPAQLAQQREVQRQQDAESAIFADPVVRAFREQFDATLKPGSIHPLDS
ncbi:DNA polymerase III subunit gamma/tau [Solimonas marina]|uniref:DNA polymerase III subunit gamma/tau n=1 Tax=Solimonas marina TaxID=2714601 RepID=A0A970B9P5_9GAMM|nr:DNA polymerase III subunit gamma/tau [Solimonas marina]NKF22581.1 DNA polymerase III subunit gamma/tau [Solimonas marina]